jgi:hypothetical protein
MIDESLNKKTINFKYEIGEQIIDNNREVTIIARKKEKDNNGIEKKILQI